MAALKFILAVTNGDLEAVQLFLNKQENSDLVNYSDECGNTPLIHASANGRENIVRYLISKGARLKPSLSCNDYGWTPLMVASYYGHFQIVAALLQSISDPGEVTYTNRLGSTALHCAARCNHIQVAELLISKGAEVNGVVDESHLLDRNCNRSPLMAAVQHGHDEMTRLLISQDANVNCVDLLTKWTPLMLAASNGHKTAVTILLENGADANLVNICGQTALDISRQMRRKDVENELEPVTKRRISDPGKSLPRKIDLIEAAKEGSLRQIQELALQSDFDVNETKEDGMTSLMWSAVKNQFRIALFLIQKGADVNIRDNPYGWTALMHAINSNHKSIICLLILNGANIQLESHDKTIPFDRATVVGDSEVIRILGAASNINEVDVWKQNSSWAFLVKTLQECLFRDKIDMKVRYNSATKELQFLDLSDNNRQGFKISWTKRINKLQYNFNRTIHLLNKRQPSKPQTLKPVSHEVFSRLPQNIDATSNPNLLTRGNDMNTALLESSTIELTDPRKTTLLPLAGPSVNEWLGEIVTPIVPPFTPTTTLDFNTKQRELTDSLLSTSPQDSEYSYGSKTKDQISPISSRRSSGQSPESSFNLSPVQSPGTSFNSGPNIRSPSQNSHFFAPKATNKFPSRRKSNSLPRIGRGTVAPVQSSRGLTKSESDESEKMKDWLEKLSLQQYTPILEENEIDTDTFLTLNKADLDQIGIKQTDAQRQILAAVQQLRRKRERNPVLMKADAWAS
ncbi:ankyrin repeat and SAM domain-containing protein 6-like isoform X2 [Dendronephthya gigantea]|uniref:ankyrin repeat and SAM domain-containing protein 6-like isoform X2 n=1 Tax=Dendronephthya gigantea TaxID=151771 RepID=UPI00106BD280|nr:ankyrin repeat and SAM domain-containing protein 6-like isoform X2 [Dendronephthya gigantea]